MTRTFLLAATGAVAIGAAFVVPAPAHADDYPDGSYRKSCSNIHYKAGDKYTLIANCQSKDSSAAAAETRLDMSGCDHDTIINDDGHLKCHFNPAVQERSDASRVYLAFEAAASIILGQQHGQNVPTLVKWMQFARAHNMFVAEFGDHTLDFGQAAKILEAYLKTDATWQERRDVYVAAYKQVYGVVPVIIVAGTDYDAEMKAGKAWYATIVASERKKKNSPAPKPTSPSNLPPIG